MTLEQLFRTKDDGRLKAFDINYMDGEEREGKSCEY